MGIFSGGNILSKGFNSITGGKTADRISGRARRLGRRQEGMLTDAGAFAESQVSPYMISPDVVQMYQDALMGTDDSYKQNPYYMQQLQAGMDAAKADLADSGILYSGKRIEAIPQVGMAAFNNYMSTLSNLMGFGRDTATQMGNIRMNTANAITGAQNEAFANAYNPQMAVQANKANLMGNIISGGSNIAKGMMGG